MEDVSSSSALWVSACLLIASAIVLNACAPLPQAHAGAGFRVERDVVYTPDDWPQALRGDLYLPLDAQTSPAVVMVHGGGWDARDRSDMDGLSEALAEQGYAVLNVDYRLAPAWRYPAAVDDVVQAARWLVAHAGAYGLDASSLGGWGYSAGVHLVALAAMRDDAPKFAAVVAGGMPSDLPHYPHSPLITAFLGAAYPDAPALWHEASPMLQVGPDTPPMFLYHGTWDRLVSYEDSANMKQALDQVGTPSELRPVKGLGHIATFVLGWGARRDARTFLDAWLKRPAPLVAAQPGTDAGS